MADTETGAAAPFHVTFKKRSAKRTGNIRKRPETPSPAASDDSSGYSSSEDASHPGQRIKRRRKNTGAVTASSAADSKSEDLFAPSFKADPNAPITSTNDATKHSNWYEEDAKTKGPAKPSTAAATTTTESKPRSVGPIQAPTNVRTTTVTDYSPDVCKDFKRSGFCGFGDSCKFLHDRSDYKQGWQLDREWESVTKGKKTLEGTIVASADRSRTAADPGADEDEEAELAMLENIPFACIICGGSYRAPVVTRCGHYFCEPCALKRYRKDPSCAACGAGTNGVFNTAKKLQKLLDRKRERMERRRQAAIEAGEEVSDQE
ncbi:hypothetical protein VTK73DRAFT_9003 [Phialemonium thermophilum]|uniref:Pre-mRNA-splicing factor CWC24 n=1 Tax=Phialemonium thermophilum TaxID=223376 RepID=A0ABR3W567_9PEZI